MDSSLVKLLMRGAKQGHFGCMFELAKYLLHRLSVLEHSATVASQVILRIRRVLSMILVEGITRKLNIQENSKSSETYTVTLKSYSYVAA